MKTFTQAEIDGHLATIAKRRGIMENAVQAVVKGFSPALFVWGPPGLGKSHTLHQILDGLAAKSWLHHTAWATPKALMMTLAESPNAIHVFEDCERMLKTDLSASILRAACGAPADRERWVTWETANERFKVKVTGGIIIVTNQNLSRANGPMQGVASRFRPFRWDMSLEERIAVIMTIASQPTQKTGVHLNAKECTLVAKTLIDMATNNQLEVALDLRLFTEHALPAFAQSKTNPNMVWEDLLMAKLTGTARTSEENQNERTNRMQQIAAAIAAEAISGKAKVEKWKATTGLGQAIFYRHLKAAKKRK